MTKDYNDGTWHGWNGGECPVHPKTFVDYIWVSKCNEPSSKLITNHPAGCLLFEGNEHGDLVAFRVVREYKGPREWWIFTNGHGDTCVSPTWRKDAIHVREILD